MLGFVTPKYDKVQGQYLTSNILLKLYLNKTKRNINIKNTQTKFATKIEKKMKT